MAKEIAVSFLLGAALSSGFTGAFKSASLAARNVAASIREMEKSPTGKLGASLASQKDKIKTLSASLQQAKGTLAGLQAQAKAAGGGTAMLARQIRQAEESVSNLNGALQRQIGQYKESAASAATTAGSVGRLAREYGKLSGQIQKQKALGAALGENRAAGQALASQRGEMRGKLATTAAAAMTVAVPAKLSIDFEQSIANVGAVANASDEDLKKLTDTARQLGRDTMFSASQAAEGMKYLAMAGFDTEKTIAAMPGMLNLAAAGNTDLGRTADIASDILSAFKMKASEMGDVADTLAKTFTTSNTDLEMLGDTMKYVAPVASSLGMTLQDTSAMAGMLGNVGIKASQAGTVMRAALLRLAAPPKMAADSLAALAGVGEDEIGKLVDEITDAQGTLDSLGMTTKDAEGNMRPMVDILEELNARTADMGTAQKAEVFKKVFGAEASAGMIALAEQAARTVDEKGQQIVDAWGRPTNALRAYMANVNDYAGTSAQIAEKRMATTQGALLLLSSAWQDAGISVGNLFLPVIKGAAGFLSRVANLISAFTERFPVLSKAVAIATTVVLGLMAGTVLLGFGLNLVKTSLNSVKGAFLRAAAAAIPATTATGAFGVASTAAGAGARIFAGGLRAIMTATGVGAALVGLGYAVSLLIDHWDEVVAAMRRAWNWVTTTWSQLGVFFTELGSNLLAIFRLTWDDVGAMADSAVQSVKDIWNGIGEFFTGLWNGVTGIFTDAWNGITAGAFWVWDQVSGIWNGAAEFFGGIVDSIAAVFTGFFDWLKDKFAWVFETIGAVSSFIDSVTGAVSDAVTGAWDAAFGDSSAKAAEGAAENSAAAAQAGAQKGGTLKEPPKFTPQSREQVNRALGEGAKAANGGKAGAGRSRKGGGASRGAFGGGGARAASGAGQGVAGGGSGPVTVVTLGGDNSKPITTFIPAGGSGKTAAVAASSGNLVLPQAGGRKVVTAGKSQGQAPGQISITQNFDVMSDDPAAFRKIMDSLRPDFEALVKKALEKLASDKRRTAYSQ